MNLTFTRAGIRLASVAGLLVVAALTVGYTTAGGGYRAPAPITPVQLTAIRGHGSDGVALTKLSLTGRLQPTHRRAQSVATQAPVVTQQTPTVRQPVTPTPTPTQTPTPSTGGTNTFDSSG